MGLGLFRVLDVRRVCDLGCRVVGLGALSGLRVWVQGQTFGLVIIATGRFVETPSTPNPKPVLISSQF